MQAGSHGVCECSCGDEDTGQIVLHEVRPVCGGTVKLWLLQGQW